MFYCDSKLFILDQPVPNIPLKWMGLELTTMKVWNVKDLVILQLFWTQTWSKHVSSLFVNVLNTVNFEWCCYSLLYSINLFLFRFFSLCWVKLYVYKWLDSLLYLFFKIDVLFLPSFTFLLIITADLINLKNKRHNWPGLLPKWQHVIIIWIIK